MTPERSFEADWKSRPNFFSLELGYVVYASMCAAKHYVSEISKKTPTVLPLISLRSSSVFSTVCSSTP